MIIFIDIETIPDQSEGARERARENLKPPANYKKPEAIAKWMDENAEEAYRRTALDGTYGEVICIGMQIEDQAPQVLGGGRSEGRPVLLQLEEALKQIPVARRAHFIFAGHCVSFDLRFLWQRAVIHDVPYLIETLHRFRNARAWHSGIMDTAYEWSGKEAGIGLKKLCRVFGIHGNDIDGANVYEAYQAGDFESIAHHCELDVRRVVELCKRMRLVKA